MRLITRWCVLVGVLLLTAGMAACAEDETPTSPTPPPTTTPPPTPTPPPPAATTASLSGTVSNSTGARIAGAKVTVLDGPLAGASTTTNAQGEYVFPILNIANANFGATSGGYREVRAGTYVDGTNTINFVFTHALLAGTVMNDLGERVGEATVTVLDGPNAGQSVTANSSGDYQFDSLLIANANLAANAQGHDEARGGTFINGTNRVDFTLVRHPDESESGIPEQLTLMARNLGGRQWEFSVVGANQENYDPKGYDWDYGDGTIENNEGPVVTHTYNNASSRTVTVRATPPDGHNSIVLTIDITVD